MESKIIQKLESHWSEIKKHAQVLHFKVGQVLFYEGHLPYGIYLLESGKLAFYKQEKVCLLDHELKIRKDRVIGLNALLNNTSNECSCQAESECHVFFISRTHLSHFIN